MAHLITCESMSIIDIYILISKFSCESKDNQCTKLPPAWGPGEGSDHIKSIVCSLTLHCKRLFQQESRLRKKSFRITNLIWVYCWILLSRNVSCAISFQWIIETPYHSAPRFTISSNVIISVFDRKDMHDVSDRIKVEREKK